MWDLDTLRVMNEEAHRRSVERAEEEAQQSPEVTHAPIYPLAILARMLITGPPSLSYLVDLMENSDAVAGFHALVREFLPEHESFIMSQDPEGRIREFAYYFGLRYFPLSDNLLMNDFTLEEFLSSIPVDLMGFNYEDYHQFNDFRAGYILMLALVESPYDDGGGGARIPILERVRELVGKGLPELIPPGGWSTKELHRMLDESEFAGAAAFADWVSANTGYWQLDASYDEYGGEHWDRYIVDQLTLDWPQVVDLQDKIHAMANWLEEDIYHHFHELLSHMLDRKDFIIPKEQLPFPLDETGQIIRKEVTASGNS